MTIKGLLVFAMTTLALALSGCNSGDSSRSEPPPPPPIVDADHDGAADAVDCAPQDALAWQLLSYASINGDGDIARANTAGQVCAGANLPANRFAAAVPANEVDCDDGNAAAWSTLSYAAIDADGDGFATASNGSMCAGAALPAGYLAVSPAAADLDCDDADSGKWHQWTYRARDDDGDGFRVPDSGTLCGQAALPAKLFSAAPAQAQMDCDDTDPTTWNWHSFYRDADGDGVGSGPVIWKCLGNGGPAAGLVSRGYDPNDDPGDPDATTVSEPDIESHMLAVSDDGDDDDIFP